jgi:aldose 1-epimerase
VDPLGGGLRALEVDGIAVIDGYPEGRPAPYAAGAVLFPWPNRVRDGRWSTDGTDHHLVVDEPELHNASHGLVRGQVFEVSHSTPGVLNLRTEIEDRPGYPFHLQLELEYRLLEDGLLVQSGVRNLGTRKAPFALGFHPYVRVGEVPASQLTLKVAASQVLDVDDQLIPIGSHVVTGTTEDPTTLPLAKAVLNHSYGGLTVVDGRHRHRLQAPDGRAVEVRTDPAFSWVQVFTCPIFPRAEGRGTAVAVEPMTAPPNALASGRDVIQLEPGASWTAGWSVHLITGVSGSRAGGRLPGSVRSPGTKE